jgi:plastocyanin
VTRLALPVVACCVAIVLPAAAHARTKTVDMGVPTASQQKFQQAASDVNDYFPHTVTIRAGDSVRFRPVGFHTVDLPPAGGDPLPLITATGSKVAGVNDAAGVAFWFNDQDQVGFNPDLAESGYGERFTYRGGKRVESGLPLGQNLRPMRVKFPKRGSYTYFCNIHPGMTGKVVVKRKRAKVPTAKQDRKRVRRQVARTLARAQQLASAQPPANTVYTGGSAKGGVEYFGMLPATLNVSAGTTVTFMMSPRSYDAHTASFGPGDPQNEPTSYLGQIAATFAGAPVFDPRGVYRSEPPGTTATYTGTLHGNGFWSSGVMDRDGASPLPPSDTVTFSQAGSFKFYCLIHPFMVGTVNVT